MLKKLVWVLAVALIAIGATPTRIAVAETLDCTVEITSVPTTITQQGVHCLVQNVATGAVSGCAITLNTSNITLDLNGWKIGGLAAGAATQAVGICASGSNNITIRNGNIRGFHTGIALTGGQGYLIEDIRAEGNTSVGIQISGGSSLIRRNQVVATGGSSVASSATGIYLVGAGFASVLDNDVTDVEGETNSYGIYTINAATSVLEGNRIAGIPDGTGIYTFVSPNIIIRDNDIVTAGVGIFGAQTTLNVLVDNNRMSGTTTGISFFFTGTPFDGLSASGGYRNNTVVGASTPYSAGAVSDLGGNEP